MTDDLKARIDDFVKAADEVVAQNWQDQEYTFSPPPTHRADFISAKWVKVITIEHDHQGGKRESSVYAFVALADFSTKTLGDVKRGDIHKPASWKAPAKHARGNVFSEDFRKALTPYGIVYLR